MSGTYQSIFFTLQLFKNAHFIFPYMGSNLSQTLNLSSEEVMEDSSLFFNLINHDDKVKLLNDLKSSGETSEPVNSIFRISVDCIVYYVEMRLTIRSREGDFVSWDGAFIDISEQKNYIPDYSRHLDFEILISKISTKFIGLRIDEIDSGIDEALQSIGSFAAVDKAYVYIFKEDTANVERIYEWCQTGIERQTDSYVNISFDQEFPEFYGILSKREVVNIPDETKLPESAGKERNHFRKQNVKSLLIIPMLFRGKLFGFLGFVSVRKTLNWSLNDQILMRLCGEIFVNALSRKRVEMRITQTDILFQEILKQSPIPMVVASPDGTIMIYNEASTEQLGVNFNDYVEEKINFFEIDPPWIDYDLQGNVIPIGDLPLAKALQGQTSQAVEVMIVRGDGSRRWHIVTGAPIFDKKGNLIAAFTAFPDISKLKQAESSLLDRINELDCLYGIYHVVEQEGVSLEDILQSTVNLMVKYWKFPHVVSASIEYSGIKYTSPYSQISCNNNSVNEVASDITVYGSKSGQVSICHCNEIPLPEGDPFYKKEENLISVIARRLGRIIEKKQSELALSLSEAKLRNYLESAPDGIFVADREGYYLEVNKAACKITEYNREELLEMKISSITYGDDLEDALANFMKCVESGRSSGDFRYVTKSGKVKTWAVEAVKLSENRFLGFAKDITENKRVLEQLRQMEKMDAIGQLAGGIAHDFNNQIAVIMGYSEMLLSKLEDPKLKHFAENILASSHRSDDLTRKLLAFAHKGLYENSPVNIHKLIGEAVDILSHSLDKRISIRLNLKAEPSFIKGDQSQIQNMLLNLSLNARDAMPEGGKLSFETSNEILDETYCETLPYKVNPGPFIRISVSDDGVGIDEKDISRIFEPFFTTKKLGKGTGMGLASVFGAVSNHHGVIEVNSSAGAGTEFQMYFPLAEKPVFDKMNRGTYSMNNNNSTVLLVDDDELVRELGQDMLKTLGYKVLTCNDGIGAVDFFKENWQQIDLVILDMIMPGLSGKDVYRRMHEINSDIPVILSSGFSMTGDIQQLLDEGASAFIGKPFEVSRFSKILADLLKRD